MKIRYQIGDANRTFSEQGLVILSKDIFIDNYIHVNSILEHIPEQLVVRQQELRLSNGFVTAKAEISTFFYQEENILRKSTTDIWLPRNGKFWYSAIKTALDFDQHPGNQEIHQYLKGRKPRYVTNNIYVTRSGKILLNHKIHGWVMAEKINKREFSNAVLQELKMVKNFVGKF